MSVIKVSNLNFSYAKGTPYEKKALDNVSFEIEKGEFVAILGHTGSGKSTLVSHLNGLVSPDSGSVFLDGEDIFKKGYDLKKARFKVGVVFQYPEYQLFEETVYKDIAFGPSNMSLSQSEIDLRVLKAAEALEIPQKLFNRSPFDLSGGQKRRVAIAGVIAMNPEVLVLDEPAAGLDPKGRDRVMRLISNYREKYKKTVIIVSHSMQEAASFADKVIVLNEGKLFACAGVNEVFKKGDELEKIGLALPPVCSVVRELKKLGADLPDDVYTAKKAAELILPLVKGGRKNAQ